MGGRKASFGCSGLSRECVVRFPRKCCWEPTAKGGCSARSSNRWAANLICVRPHLSNSISRLIEAAARLLSSGYMHRDCYLRRTRADSIVLLSRHPGRLDTPSAMTTMIPAAFQTVAAMAMHCSSRPRRCKQMDNNNNIDALRSQGSTDRWAPPT